MARQTRCWDEWIVVDDGTQSHKYSLGQRVLRRNPKSGEMHSICENIWLASLKIPCNCDKIMVVEDDDYYSPAYIEIMSNLLNRHSLVGIEDYHVYNVSTRKYFIGGDRVHAALAATALRSSNIEFLANAAWIGNSSLDLELWRMGIPDRKIFRVSGIQVSIKGMPGTPGISKSHRDGHGTPDQSLTEFHRLGLPFEYLKYYQSSQK